MGFFDSWWTGCVNTNICMCVAVCVRSPCMHSQIGHAMYFWSIFPGGAFGISFIAGKKKKVDSFGLPFKLEWFQSFLEERKWGGGQTCKSGVAGERRSRVHVCHPPEFIVVWGEIRASRNINTSYGNVPNFGSQPSCGGGDNKQPLWMGK